MYIWTHNEVTWKKILWSSLCCVGGKKWNTTFSLFLGLINRTYVILGLIVTGPKCWILSIISSLSVKSSTILACCLSTSVYGHALTVINGDKWSTKPWSQMIMKCSLSSNLNSSKNSAFNLQQDNVSLAEPFEKCMHTNNKTTTTTKASLFCGHFVHKMQ